MGLQGNLSGFTLSEIFRMISFSSKTGQLVVARDSKEGRVYFREGNVHFASTPENRLPIGLRLVDAGIISREHLEEALTVQRAEPERRLGAILVSKGFVAQDVLTGFVREQIQDALFEIFEWEDGTYYFEPDPGAEEDVGISLQIDDIVAEAERRRQEWETIRAVLPSIESPVRLSTNAVAAGETIEIEPQEWASVCSVANGARLTDLRSVLHLTSLGVCRIVARLITRGVLELVPLPQELEIPSDEIPSLHAIESESLHEQLADYREQGLLAAQATEESFEVAAEDLDGESVEEPAGPLSEVAEEAEAEAAFAAVVEDGSAEETADEAGSKPLRFGEPAEQADAEPVSAIRKYITHVTAGRRGYRGNEAEYPVEWLTYYGRLQHNKSKGPSEQELFNRMPKSSNGRS